MKSIRAALDTPVEPAGEAWAQLRVVAAGRDNLRRAREILRDFSHEQMVRFVLGGAGYPQRPHHYGLRLDTDS